MKKESTALQMLKILLTYLGGCLLWLLIFSFNMPPDETGATSEPFPGAICVLGIVTATVVLFIRIYNSMQRAYQQVRSASSNIKIFKERTERLLDKANRVADKYMSHEESVQVGVAEKRSQKPKVIRNSQQFQVELERYPDLKSNESVMELLNQIRDTENGYAQSKLNYNAIAEHYNTLIHCFPNNILRRCLRFEDAEFYNDASDAEVTDEELGL